MCECNSIFAERSGHSKEAEIDDEPVVNGVSESAERPGVIALDLRRATVR
jgi:hypothetical protein